MMDVVAMEKELAGLYNERSKNLLNVERYDWYTKKIYELREQLNEAIFGKALCEMFFIYSLSVTLDTMGVI